jgi:uncharacterized membrane protein YgaE (UPF0421/DUF939 family)
MTDLESRELQEVNIEVENNEVLEEEFVKNGPAKLQNFVDLTDDLDTVVPSPVTWWSRFPIITKFLDFCKQSQFPLQVTIGITLASLFILIDAIRNTLPDQIWLVVTVIIVIQTTMFFGAFIKKAVMRVLGTIVGAIAAMLVLLIVYNLGSGSLQTGAKPYLLAILSVPVYWGSTVLVMKYPQYQYASVMTCIVYVLIIFGEYRVSTPTSGLTHPNWANAVFRTLSIAAGVIVSFLVCYFVFPIRASEAAEALIEKLAKDISKLFKYIMNSYTSENVSKYNNTVFVQESRSQARAIRLSLDKLIAMLEHSEAEVNLFKKPHRYPVEKYRAMVLHIRRLFFVLVSMFYVRDLYHTSTLQQLHFADRAFQLLTLTLSRSLKYATHVSLSKESIVKKQHLNKKRKYLILDDEKAGKEIEELLDECVLILKQFVVERRIQKTSEQQKESDPAISNGAEILKHTDLDTEETHFHGLISNIHVFINHIKGLVHEADSLFAH